MKILRTMTLSLNNKIQLLMVAVISCLILFILLAVSLIVSRETTVLLQKDLKKAQSTFEEFQDLRLKETRLIVSMPFLRALLGTRDTPTILQFARDLQKKIGNDLFIMTDGEGEVLARTDEKEEDKPLSSHPVIQGALQNRETSGLLSVEDTVYQITAFPVVFRGKILSTVVVGFKIGDLQVERIKGMTNSEISFIRDNRIIASTWLGKKRGELQTKLNRISTELAGWSQQGSVESAFELTIGGEEYLSMIIPVEKEAGQFGGVYLLQRSKDEASRFLGTIKKTIVVFGLLVGFVTAWISFLFIRQILRPISKLVDALKAIADGDLSVSLEVNQKDEIGILARAFFYDGHRAT